MTITKAEGKTKMAKSVATTTKTATDAKDAKHIDTLVNKINDSVMFNLSLSSIELFHSNFLALIFQKYPDVFYMVIGKTPPPVDLREFRVEREKRKVDITVTHGKSKYFIENKVKDILRQEQYDKICDNGVGKYYLFSLLGDDMRYIDETNKPKWKELGYSHIVKVLKNYSEDRQLNEFTPFVRDYCEYMPAFIELLNEYSSRKKYLLYNDSEVSKRLEKAKLRAIFYKCVMVRFMHQFHQKFDNECPHIGTHWGINRSNATMDFRVEIHHPEIPNEKRELTIRIQTENDQFRIFAECDTTVRNDLEECWWFDKKWRSANKREYLKYGVDHWYQIDTEIDLRNMSFDTLMDLIYNRLKDGKRKIIAYYDSRMTPCQKG